MKEYIFAIAFILSLVAAMIAAAAQPTGASTYPATVPYFIGAMFFGVIFLVLWHQAHKSSGLQRLRTMGTRESIASILNQSIAGLTKRIGSFESHRDLAWLQETSISLDALVSAKAQLTDRLGIERAALLACEIASAERRMNRLISMSLDEYFCEEESANLLDQALQALKRAMRIADEAGSLK